MLTRSLRIVLGDALGQPDLNRQVLLSADAVEERSIELVADPIADLPVALALAKDDLVAIEMVSDVVCTVTTNNPVDDTFVLAPGKPLLWYAEGGSPVPLTADIAELHVAKPGVPAGTLEIRAMFDSTP